MRFFIFLVDVILVLMIITTAKAFFTSGYEKGREKRNNVRKTRKKTKN